MTTGIPRLVCVAVLATLTASSAEAQRPRTGHGKLDAALSSGDVDQRARVIVQYRDGSGEKVRRRAEARGGRVRRQHRIINAVTIDVSRREIGRLAEDPDVLRISIDARVRSEQRSSKKTSTPKTPNAHLLRQIVGAPAHGTGKNIGVAVVDSGIAATPDLTVAASVDFTGSGEPRMTDPSDPYGHGRHVAGLIAGNGALSGGCTAASRLARASIR